MSASEPGLTKVERRLLDELLIYRGQLGHVAPAPTRRGRWIERALVAGIAVVAAALVAVVVGRVAGGGAGALAATPDRLAYSAAPTRASGSGVLLSLAAAADRQPTPAQTGRYAYVRTLGWYLDSRISGAEVTSTVVPTETETWLAADRRGKLLVHALTASRGVGLRGARATRVLDDAALPPGLGPSANVTATSPAEVIRQLDVGHPRTDGPVERFVALSDLALARPIPSRVRAAILRALADTPGLVNAGTVTDRLGRRGFAVSLVSSYSGLPTRYSYVFSAGGTLLDEEENLLNQTGNLHVRPGSVIAYTVFAAARWTSGVGMPN